MDRQALEDRYLHLTRQALPARAAQARWPLRFDHCFMRVILDHVVGGRWYDHLPGRGPAYRRLSDADLRRAVELAETLLAEDRQTLQAMNRQSLAWRGKG